MRLGHIGAYVFDGTMADLGRIDASNAMAAQHMEQSQKLRQARMQVEADALAVKEIEHIEKKKSTRQERRKAMRDKKKRKR